jgi:hypothetical protein
MADDKRTKARPAQRSIPPEKKTGFRPGKSGVCEAQLWEFTGPSKFLPEDEEIPVERVAAGSLDDALKFMRRRYPDFIIVKAVATGMIAMLSGSPFE